MAKFEKVSKYANVDINMPKRKTAYSAGYDMEVAEDIIIPSYNVQHDKMLSFVNALDIASGKLPTYTLDDMAAITKATKAKPTLVPTGMKCKLEPDTYLELSVRSSCPLKHWLILANSVGIIDADYYNNEDNEGHIYFQMINLSPFDIQLKKGDTIGQGIIKHYITTEDDVANGERKGGFGSTNE
jgi:dUTP pyrophosphatase